MNYTRVKLLYSVKATLSKLYSVEIQDADIQIDKTKDGFVGHYTVVVFPFVKFSKKKPEDIANEIGICLQRDSDIVSSYNVVKGFLNICCTAEAWIYELNELNFEINSGDKQKIMLEFSSPNTNKPLHLGHIRNNLLGESISRILKKNNNEVIKVNLVNDRGIHICKSMWAWMTYGNNQTPESTATKGDKFVGNFYVLFNEKQQQFENQADKSMPSPLQEAQALLVKWEQGDDNVIKTWKLMNEWVYQGFEVTYKSLGISFDKTDYESTTYLLGKKYIQQGLADKIFERAADGSVFIDLTNEGLDRKILLRADGTTVYITQDIGTAITRLDNDKPDTLIYVVGDEQIYHFEVLQKIIAKLRSEYTNKIEHLAYGMVELPEGKMKSREGTVVDADDLIAEMYETAKEIAETSGKINDLDPLSKQQTLYQIALGALKYYILKVDPKKQMVYNPKESIDFNGNTGPFIQYTYARIASVLRKAEEQKICYTSKISVATSLLEIEIKLISILVNFKEIIAEAAQRRSPAVIANYVYDLAKTFNKFYQDHSILKETNTNVLLMKLTISARVGKTIKEAMELLGIEVPEKM
jgi:arginyl-tRNA synthetase